MFGPFPHPHSDFIASQPRSTLELRLSGLSAIIRNKPDWHIKRLDSTIVAKWRGEAVAQHVTPVQFKFIIDELTYYDKLRDGSTQVADVDGVYRSSDFLPLELKSDFARLVADLAEIPEKEKDWHPGSDNTVLDLIHPGLYLFVSGKTRTIPRGQSVFHASVPTSLPKPPPRNSGQFMSSEYQWIPTPVSVDQEGKVEFLSYINNLHPRRRRDLYRVLANIFSLTLPVFERVLAFLKSPLKPKIDLGLHKMYDESTEPKMMDGEDQDTFDNRYEEWYDQRPLNPILVPEFTEPSSEPPVVLRNCRLQVIVKIQEIHLTPEKPSYAGGVWHIEGMENESIVASAIYYYECSNITECTLSFRQSVYEPNYEQNDHRGVEAFYGLMDGEPLVQNLGSVTTKSGLLLAWPNIYQHRVSSFELIDKTKPGKRGILVFFLVDPDTPMEFDTENVPPQQKKWWLEELEHDPTLVAKLPSEIRDMVYDWVDDPMPLEVAKEHRQKSMDERKYIRDNDNEFIFEREFSLCEH